MEEHENKMKSQDFNNDQLMELENFLKVCKTCHMKKINPSFLLYLVSRNGNQNRYTKSNTILLRDTLPRRKRLELEFLLRKK